MVERGRPAVATVEVMATAEQHPVRIALAAAEKPQPDRAAFLDRVCESNRDLRRAVEVLLAEDDDERTARDFLEPPIAGLAAQLADLWLLGNATKSTD